MLSFSVFIFPFHNRGDTLGNFFVASGKRIYLISAVNNIVTTYVGDPDHGSSAENIAATSVLISSNVFSSIRITGDSLGNVFYIDNCRIRKVLAGSKLVSTVVGSTTCGYTGENTAALATQLYYPNALWLDTTGNLIIGDYYSYRIRKWTVSTGLVSTIAGTGTQGFSDALPATSAMFYSVYDIIGDTNGNIYFSDWYDNRVRQITTSGLLVTYAGDGGCCSVTENSLATSSHIDSPTGLQIDSSGKLYISLYNKIAVVDPSTTFITTVIGGCSGYTGNGGPATSACIVAANSIWIDTNSQFYLTQARYYRIRKVTSNIITLFAGTGNFAFTGDGGPAKNAQLYEPAGTFVDTNGKVFIADTKNCRVRLVDTAGIISSIGGNVFCQSSGDNSPFSQSSLNYPVGIWKDTAGNLYISEAGTVAINEVVNYYMTGISRIRKVTAATNIITTIAGGGGSTIDNILATSYSFSLVRGIWGDTNNNLFIVDTNRHNVKKMSLSSSLLITVAGSGTSGFLDNVPATSGKLYSPYGVWVDTIGRLFIADEHNHRIRKVENGIITTFAGTGTTGFNGNGHLATATNLYYPYGLTGDTNGNIYVADTYNKRIRLIYAVNATANVVTTVTGTGSSSISKGLLPATTASLSYPVHVAVDTNGNLYATEDESAHTIRKTVLAASPTSQPSRQPTGQPTGQPTTQPFSRPTGQPSRDPTGQPSGQPTKQPFGRPTAQPSVQPSGQPTLQPSSQPTQKPSPTECLLTNFAGNGTTGFLGENLLATSAEMNPTGLW
jgi:sugar lactone lactonase YvrE